MGSKLPLPQKRAEPPNFSHMSITAKRLDGSRWNLAIELGLGPFHIVLDGDPASLPTKGHSLQFSVDIYCGQTVAHFSYCWALVII